MGYNVGDNYLYGIAGLVSGLLPTLYRLNANGDPTAVAPLNITLGNVLDVYNLGDVDENSIYWASVNGGNFLKFDLKPGSPTFGQQILQSTAINAPTALSVYDWAYVPGGGDALWAVAYQSVGLLQVGKTILMKFTRSTATWSTSTTFTVDTGSTAGLGNLWDAAYASNGYLYSTELITGQIWRFPVTGGTTAKFMSSTRKGLLAPADDGARCINAVAI